MASFSQLIISVLLAIALCAALLHKFRIDWSTSSTVQPSSKYASTLYPATPPLQETPISPSSSSTTSSSSSSTSSPSSSSYPPPSHYYESVNITSGDPSGQWSIDKRVLVTHKKVAVNGNSNSNSRESSDGGNGNGGARSSERGERMRMIDVWTITATVRECMVDVPSQLSIWLRSLPTRSQHRNDPNNNNNNNKKKKLAFNPTFFARRDGVGVDRQVIRSARIVHKHEIGSDGCRHYNASIDVFDSATYLVTVTRDYLGAGVIFSQEQVDILKTFAIWHATDPYEFNTSYAARWAEFGVKTLDVTKWLRPLANQSIGGFDIDVGHREVSLGTAKVDAWMDLPFCHEREVINSDHGITAGGRWIGGAWVASNCILAKLPLDHLSKLMRGLRVRIMGDSNFLKLMDLAATKMQCGNNITATMYWSNHNQCPLYSPHVAPFQFVYKFFRGLTKPWDDGFTSRLMDDKELKNLCKYEGKDADTIFNLLDIDRYNVTIILPGLWQISQMDSSYALKLASQLRKAIQLCRAHDAYKASGHMLFIQEITSVDSQFHNWYGGWRRLRNADLDSVNKDQAAILASQVDGVIPVFEMSLRAIHGQSITNDPVHYVAEFYEAMLQLQVVHIAHAVELKKRKDNNNNNNNNNNSNFMSPRNDEDKDYWFLKMRDN